jgi:hypothetical protein
MHPDDIAKNNLAKKLKREKDLQKATIDLLYKSFLEHIRTHYFGERLALPRRCGDRISIVGNWGYLPAYYSNLKDLLPIIGSKLEKKGWWLSWEVEYNTDWHVPITFYLRPDPGYKTLLTKIKEFISSIKMNKNN